MTIDVGDRPGPAWPAEPISSSDESTDWWPASDESDRSFWDDLTTATVRRRLQMIVFGAVLLSLIIGGVVLAVSNSPAVHITR